LPLITYLFFSLFPIFRILGGKKGLAVGNLFPENRPAWKGLKMPNPKFADKNITMPGKCQYVADKMFHLGTKNIHNTEFSVQLSFVASHLRQ
jgi:hypothetical protein